MSHVSTIGTDEQRFSITSSKENYEEKREVLSYENQDISHIPEGDVSALKKHHIVPGAIAVVYTNSSKVHLDNQSQKFIYSNVSTRQLDEILSRYQIESKYDLAAGMTDAEIQTDYERMSRVFAGDVPDRRSIQTYKFPESADIIRIIKEIRALPFVRSADPVYTTELSYTKTQLSSINSTTVGTTPTDPYFGTVPPADWWYFNRIQIFTGLNVFGSVTSAKTPVIAVIDDSFDTDSSALDRPNYQTGKLFLNCSGVNVGCATGSDVRPATTDTSSHGTSVATVLAAPINNSHGVSGVSPFAKIIPYKVTVTAGAPQTDNSVATAIRDAKNNADVDAINVSLASAGGTCPKPIHSSVVRTEVASAFAAGKVVVFAAGNAHANVSTSCSGSSDGGAIIVGGMTKDTTTGRNKAWVDGPGAGTNYDMTTTKIDIAAPAKNIYAATYDRLNNQRNIIPQTGTSFAAPMVTATAAMMMRLYKSQNPGFALTAGQVEAILLAASDPGRFSESSITSPETKLIGRKLDQMSDPGNTQMVGMRVLNVHNAMVMVKHLKQYQALVRLHNSDNKSESTVNSVWSGTLLENVSGQDTIWGVGSLSTGNKFVFRTYNDNAATGYTYGRSYLRMNSANALTDFVNFGGVWGAAWAENNSIKPIGHYSTTFEVTFN